MHKELLWKIDGEIKALIERENSGLTTNGQYQLHLLLENRKDLMKMGESYDGYAEPMESARGGGRSGI